MIEIKPLDQYPEAVYIDGKPLAKQLIDGLTYLDNGEISVKVYTDSRLSYKEGAIDPRSEVIPYQSRQCEIHPRTRSNPEQQEITIFYFRLTNKDK